MKIWIDGDACPKAIKQILYRAAVKRRVLVIIVANHLAVVPSTPFIKRVKVDSGCDKADDYIVSHIEANDLVITADIILADAVITGQAVALNPRGGLYNPNNIKQILAARNLKESLRESGVNRGGLDTLNAKEIQVFSNNLDKILSASLG